MKFLRPHYFSKNFLYLYYYYRLNEKRYIKTSLLNIDNLFMKNNDSQNRLFITEGFGATVKQTSKNGHFDHLLFSLDDLVIVDISGHSNRFILDHMVTMTKPTEEEILESYEIRKLLLNL